MITRRRRVRRIVVRAIVFLLLGAVVNVAVAWGCGLVIPVIQSSETSILAADGDPKFASNYVNRTSGFGMTQYVVLSSAGDTYYFDDPDKTFPQVDELLPTWADRTGLNRFHSQHFESRGMPLQALHCSWTRPQSINGTTTAHGGIKLFGDVVLPLRVFWRPFSINSILWAIVLWLAVPMVIAWRSRQRLSRGLCPKCKYPIGTSQVCTECGAKVKPTDV